MMNSTQQEALATLKTGIVTAVKKGYIQASIPEFGDFITDWLPVLIFGDTQNNKSFAMPAVGAQVKLLLDARGEDGVCLGSIYSDVDIPTAPSTEAIHTTFSDGAVIEYDPISSTFRMTGFKNGILDGEMLDFTANTINFNASQTTFNSAVTVNGLLKFTAGMTGSGSAPGGNTMTLSGNLMHSDGSVISNGVVLHLHVHPVTAVGSNTGNPVVSAFRKLASFFKPE